MPDYVAKFVYVLGQIHSAPDALSYHPMAPAVLSLSDNMVLQESMAKAQQQFEDPVFLYLKAQASLGQSGFEVRKNLIVKVSSRLVLPIILPDASELQQYILKDLHESALGGHLVRYKLHALVSQHLFWPKLDAIVR